MPTASRLRRRRRGRLRPDRASLVRGVARRRPGPRARSCRSATPTASSAAITATRWARYQVLPTAAAHHHTVPVAKISVVSARTASADAAARRASTTRRRTPTAARPIAIALLVRSAARQAATNGSSTSAGQGRERAAGPARWAARWHRTAGRCPGSSRSPADVASPAGTGNGIQARPLRKASACHTKWLYWLKWTGFDRAYSGERAQRDAGARRCTAARRLASAARSGEGARSGPSAILRLHLQRCVRRLPVTASGFGCARPGDDDGRGPPARHRLADPGDPGDRPGLPADHGIRRSKDSADRASTRTSGCSDTGRTTSPSTARAASTTEASYADYTPGYLYALWLVGVVAARFGWRGIGDTDQAAGDPHRRRPRLRRVPDGPRPRRHRRAARCSPARRRDRQPDHLVRLGHLGPGRQLRHGVPAARRPRAVEGPRSERAAILAVVAALVKPQLAILVPIVAFVVIRRALWPAGGYGDEAGARAVGLRLGAADHRRAPDPDHRPSPGS